MLLLHAFPYTISTPRRTGLAAAAVFLFAANPVWAQDRHRVDWSINGFGTLGAVHSSEDDADFVSDPFAPDGVGYTADWSAEVDSRLGLQVTADFTPRFSSVLQVIVEQRYDDTYRPDVEWANVSYDVTPGLSIRAGRMILPIFMTSGYRKVGYANPWVRPPREVYRLVPVTNIDGIDLAHRSRFSGFTNTFRATYGDKDEKLSDGGEVEARGAFMVTDTLERGAASFFIAYSRSRLTVDKYDPLFEGYRQFGSEGEAIAERYDADDSRFEVLSVGARYDPGDWFLMGEWARSESRTFLGDNRGWYLGGGYRFGALTPYLTLGQVRAHGKTSDPGIDAPQTQQLDAALNELLRFAAEQTSVAVGTRWDFARSAALKVQFDYIDLEDDSGGVLTNEQPGFDRGGSVSLFSATLDFVF